MHYTHIHTHTCVHADGILVDSDNSVCVCVCVCSKWGRGWWLRNSRPKHVTVYCFW